VRRELGLDGEIKPASLGDKASFTLWAALSLITLVLVLIVLFALLVLTLLFLARLLTS
jgi:hypothetical protein